MSDIANEKVASTEALAKLVRAPEVEPRFVEALVEHMASRGLTFREYDLIQRIAVRAGRLETGPRSPLVERLVDGFSYVEGAEEPKAKRWPDGRVASILVNPEDAARFLSATDGLLIPADRSDGCLGYLYGATVEKRADQPTGTVTLFGEPKDGRVRTRTVPLEGHR